MFTLRHVIAGIAVVAALAAGSASAGIQDDVFSVHDLVADAAGTAPVEDASLVNSHRPACITRSLAAGRRGRSAPPSTDRLIRTGRLPFAESNAHGMRTPVEYELLNTTAAVA
jgi:hypothetical protein